MSIGLTMCQPEASRLNVPDGWTSSTVQRSHGPLVATYTPCAVWSPSFAIINARTNSSPTCGVGGSSWAAMRSANGGTGVAVGDGGTNVGVGGTGVGDGLGLGLGAVVATDVGGVAGRAGVGFDD